MLMDDELGRVERLKKLAGSVQGFLTEAEGLALYDYAKRCSGRGVIVEIGSWKGRSSIWLASGSKHGRKITLYCIDPHTGSPECREMFGPICTLDEFLHNIHTAKVDNLVVPVVKTSEQAAREFLHPVELIFIDGDHDYESVKRDFELWYPKLVTGGVIAFHDSTVWPGPKAVVRQAIYRSRHFKNIRVIDSLTFAEKSTTSLKDRFKNRYALMESELADAARRLRLPKSLRKLGKTILRRMRTVA